MLHQLHPSPAALLEDLPVSSLIAALLGARDSTVVAFGMLVRGWLVGWMCWSAVHEESLQADRRAGAVTSLQFTAPSTVLLTQLLILTTH